MLPDDRRELWLLGLGLGLCVNAGLLLAAIASRWPLNEHTLPAWAGVAVSVTTLGLFGLPLAYYGLTWAWAAFWTIRQTREDWNNRNQPPDDVGLGDTQPVTVIRQVPVKSATGESAIELTETRPASWLAWRTLDVDGLAWANALGGDISSSAMVGPALAFGDVDGWGAWVDHLADNGLATARRNGVKTRLLVEVGDCLRRVRAGDVEMPSTDPPAISKPPLGALRGFSSFSGSDLRADVAQKG